MLSEVLLVGEKLRGSGRFCVLPKITDHSYCEWSGWSVYVAV